MYLPHVFIGSMPPKDEKHLTISHRPLIRFSALVPQSAVKLAAHSAVGCSCLDS